MSLRPRLADDRGNTLIVTIIISMVVGLLVALGLDAGRQADWSSMSDRNHEGSLGIAEAGIHEQIARIESTSGGAVLTNIPALDGSTQQGTYHVEATKCPPDAVDPQRTVHETWCTALGVPNGYVIDAKGSAGTKVFKRDRHLRVALLPPELFPGQNTKYTIFSNTSIDLANNDTINNSINELADIWANDSVTIGPNVRVRGSITSAKSWIDSSANGTEITGDVWSGGYNPNGNWAMNLGHVTGSAKASVTAPTDPDTCGGQPTSKYTVQLGSVTGDITTWGSVSGGTPSGSLHQGTCTAAAAPLPFPDFTYNRYNYDQAILHEFASVAAFKTWVAANSTQLSSIRGTFVVDDSSPSQANRLDLTGWNLGGDLTVISTAPIYTGEISDANLPYGVKPKLTLVSHYAPPVGSTCDVNHDDSDCAIHVKNHMTLNADGTCLTATLIYADHGPVAIKNTSNSGDADMCGTVISDAILVKNNEVINYDSRVERTIGFGRDAFEIGRWEELPVS